MSLFKTEYFIKGNRFVEERLIILHGTFLEIISDGLAKSKVRQEVGGECFVPRAKRSAGAKI